ncbi:MAG: hypothetical protein O3C40_26865 [Planctomycetota bacterium]|nr:hypothetical protein [Planctomycetota bacterium]
MFNAATDLLRTARSLWVDPDKKKGGRDAMDKVNGCLGSVIDDLSAIVPEKEDGDGRAFPTLLGRAKAFSGELLHKQLSDWLIQQFHASPDTWVTWFDLLFFVSGKKPKASSIVFELSDQSAFDHPVNHQQVYEFVNACLQKVDSSVDSEKACSGPDAFAAMDGGREERFPEVKMSRFGKINLRAMSRESLCQVRYGVAESKSFPVAQSIRQECKNALEWISRDERRGVTWCDITSVSGAATVLFAYPSKLSEQPPALAFLISGDEDPTAMHVEGQFEACAQTIATALSGRSSAPQESDILIFVLTKPDGFRTKVLYSNRCTEVHIISSARDWEMGCLNIPPVKSRQFGPEKGSKPQWRDPITPFTTEIIACLNTVWQRQGTHAIACKTVRVADALSLLLDRDSSLKQTAGHLLEIALKNSTGLLLATGQASTQARVHAVARNLQKHQLLNPRILGLLLWKLGYHKGDYMKTPAFWVGRMLSLADQLHLQYCYQVRKKDVPPQLVGNSLMSTALSTPEHAISILAERMKPYHAWAQTVQTGENVGLAKYLLSQLSKVSTQLAEHEIPKKTNDSDRATMLLGYLSRPEKETPTDKTDGDNEDDNRDEE